MHRIPKYSVLLSTAVAAGGIAYLSLSEDSKRPRLSSLLAQTAHSDSPNVQQIPSNPLSLWKAPKRADVISDLKSSSQSGSDFDLLIIGGGATGVGCAVDASNRGLKVAMVERDDFSSGTSSKSTKLVHGGVRYLQSAIMKLDYGQWKMVKEALHERKTFLNVAPHLSNELAILLPVYTWWKLPYFWFGCKLYDILSGEQRISSSYYLLRKKTLDEFPMINSKDLVGSIVYYDGQFNDSRMNVALAMTAAAQGATVCNHIEVISLIKEPGPSGSEVVKGAVVRDSETGHEFEIKAKGVINATGPFSDKILQMDKPAFKNIVSPSSGVHIVLPSYFSPRNLGLLDAETSDGRVVFFLPWEGRIVAGTTDAPCGVEKNAIPSESDINWILGEVNKFLSSEVRVRREDVLSAWSGIRPLVCDPSSKNTKDLVRNHLIYKSDSDLITIVGGKWTTYREMSEQTIDEAIKTFGLAPAKECTTKTTHIVGAETWTPNTNIRLIQDLGLPEDVARHLSHNYGDLSWAVCYSDTEDPSGWSRRLHPNHPFIEAEVMYAVDQEYARTVIDVFARRIRLAFLDSLAARDSIPRIVELMGKRLGWDSKRKDSESNEALEFLSSMGLKQEDMKLDSKIQKTGLIQFNNASSNLKLAPSLGFSFLEMGFFRSAFCKMDRFCEGSVKYDSLISYLKSSYFSKKPETVDEYIKKNNLDSSKKVSFEEFLQTIKDIKGQ
ncbi:hypothetical protein BB559_003824 [Furculomyces boomerangus]|uniref:Glycerol-3-phosphate dehydrogenase n=2 Tax=Harpellales TaxID=61421 RepID=A0A2T9YIM3_9FUNG|nr:hypothetical protein BB559_003824 [Furculomyces boomerangus]PWA02201.1 hypothetical protein BB558_001660 [Smittium angustum]